MKTTDANSRPGKCPDGHKIAWVGDKTAVCFNCEPPRAFRLWIEDPEDKNSPVSLKSCECQVIKDVMWLLELNKTV